jgi:YfiH family protein
MTLSRYFLMQRQKSDGIEWLEFDLLQDIPRLKHAVFLRHGGYSEGPYASLNVDFSVGDKEEHVQANLQRIKTQLQQQNSNWNHLVRGKACHGKSIAVVNAQSPEEVIDFDGLMTATPGVSLLMKHADCQIALFYDPKNHAIANIHAGWRGSVVNIYGETVQQMQKIFGSNPANLLVCISPSLGPDEAEFMHYRRELPEEFWPFQVRPTYFDFWAISEHQLQAAGILPHHIEVARLSTYSNSYDFFSYRRDKITGRHATCITLN